MQQFGTELQGTLAKYMLSIAQADDDTAEDLEMFSKLLGIVLAAREELMQIYTRMEETKNKIDNGQAKTEAALRSDKKDFIQKIRLLAENAIMLPLTSGCEC